MNSRLTTNGCKAIEANGYRAQDLNHLVRELRP